MLKLLIIDDEAPARARMRRMLEATADCEVLAEAASGVEALDLIAECTPDALLLDISMPGLDGMSLAHRLREMEPAPAVIFCTAWPDHALDAFDVAAVDYLLKPVRQERLEAALDKARQAGAGGRAAPESDQVFLRSTLGGRTVLIPLGQVACFVAEDKYTTVFHDGGKSVLSHSLIELEREHGERFARVHRNALVARDRIRGLERNRAGVVCVILDGCEHRPQVSRRQQPELRRLIRALE